MHDACLRPASPACAGPPCPRVLACAHLPQVPAPTHSLLGTTGTPCSLLCRWPALAAVGPTEMSALGTCALGPQTASASECPRSRQHWGHCLQGSRDRTIVSAGPLQANSGCSQGPAPRTKERPLKATTPFFLWFLYL